MRTDSYPQLLQLCWSAEAPFEVSRQEAFAIYEGNWRHVLPNALSEPERAFILGLLSEFGPSPVIRNV